MQIANAFKELHKHKIMHRDVKLANIFLHDDTVIVGDFGFAKSNVEITTTKLGTPMTMSPEMFKSHDSPYTNKADLWSIGCIFYQLLFGIPPYRGTNIEDIIFQMKKFSGSENVPIPNGKSISKECQDLLNGIFKFDPNERMEWRTFFHHPLFDLYSDKKSLTESDFFPDFHESVRKTFRINKLNSESGEIQLEHPLENKTPKINPEKIKGAILSNEEKIFIKDLNPKSERYQKLKRIKKFFLHQINVTRFYKFSVRFIASLVKKEIIDSNFNNKLMYCAAGINKKACLKTENIIKSLNQRLNYFNLECFDDFCDLGDVKKIKSNFKQTLRFYEKAKNQYKNYFEIESKKPSIQEKYSSIISFKTNEIHLLDNQLFDYFLEILDHYKFNKPPEISVETREALGEAILKSYFCIRCHESLPFTKDGDYLDWKDVFLKFNDKKFIRDSLENFESGIFETCV